MRKTLGIFIFLSILLGSCTFPSGNSDPTPDAVATLVVVQLTQMATQTGGPVETKATTTLSPAASATPLQATATKAASSATATSAPSATPAVTETQAASPTIPPTATALPGDPIALLVATKPVWKDNYLNGKGWGLEGNPYDDNNTRVEIKNNAMVLTSYGTSGWHGWRLSYLNPQDFYLESTIQTKECSGADLYGLMFRATDTSGYWFGVTCDGRFNLRSGDINDFTDIAAYTKSSLILAGSNQTNRLGVWVKGSQISLYANGKLLGNFEDSTFSSAGKFGYFIARQKTASFVVQSTEIAYWKLP